MRNSSDEDSWETASSVRWSTYADAVDSSVPPVSSIECPSTHAPNLSLPCLPCRTHVSYCMPCLAMPCHAMPCHAMPMPCQAKPSQAKPSQAKSSQVKSSQVKSSQVKSSQVKSSQVKSSQTMYVLSNHNVTCHVKSFHVIPVRTLCQSCYICTVGCVCTVYNVCNACNVFNVIYAKGIHHVMFTTYEICGIRVMIAIFVMSAAYGLYVTCAPCPRNVS